MTKPSTQSGSSKHKHGMTVNERVEEGRSETRTREGNFRADKATLAPLFSVSLHSREENAKFGAKVAATRYATIPVVSLSHTLVSQCKRPKVLCPLGGSTNMVKSSSNNQATRRYQM